MEWKKSNGKSIEQGKYEIIKTNSTQTILKISTLKAESYSCFVFASTGTIKQTIEINRSNTNYFEFNIKKPKPKLISLSIESNYKEHELLKLNQTYNFECITDSMWPVFWMNNSRTSSQNYSINKSTLIFNSLNESNLGEYVCISSNHLVKSEAHLIIDSKSINIINRSFKKTSTTNKNKSINDHFKKINKKFKNH